MKRKTKLKEKGITLVALIITIIVILILVGVTIGQITGSDGIIKRAQNSTSEYKQKTVEEQVAIIMHEYMVANVENGTSVNDFLDGKQKEKVIDSYKVNEDGTVEITIGDKTVKVNKDPSIADNMILI